MEKNSMAEVDYVITTDRTIVPIEVKAGTKGSMQSMYLFMDKKHCEYGIRTCLEPFSCYGKVKVAPLYAISNMTS
jgi:predicted AAA+ superfamily ATPase